MGHRFIVAVLGTWLLSGCSNAPGFTAWSLEELSPAQGFFFRTPTFEVPPATELQSCYFVKVPDLGGTDLWVGKTVTAINPGSHHMNVFRVRTVTSLGPGMGQPFREGNTQGTVLENGECYNSAAWADWPLVANTQKSNPNDPYTVWKLPDGVAHRFTPGEDLMIQIHYVNTSTQQTPFRGRVGINFYRSNESNPQELGTLFATQQSIRICRSNPFPVFHGTCAFPPGTVHVTAANGHFHSRGTRFRVYDWDGRSDTRPPESSRFYDSRSWDDPEMTTGLDIRPVSGGGVWWTCEYAWREPSFGCSALDAKDPQGAGDCCYTFGPQVDPNEHCNVFVYYWPKLASNVFCN